MSIEPPSSLETDLRVALTGEVAFDRHTRAVYATDSSNYRQLPLGVVFPKDHDDVVRVMTIAASHDVPVTARGAGTSLAGQACNDGLIVDTSRHLTTIQNIDPDARTARVQPGVVLDDLRRAAEQHELTFGPDPATHAWCTLGGMIGNNSCGTHALFAGKTVDNVESLRVVLYGGATLELGAYDDAGYANAVAAGGAQAAVLGGLKEVGRRAEPLVREHFPTIERRVSGYNLDRITPGQPLDVAKLLVGTESTCAIVTEATLTLSASPQHRRLVVIGYRDIIAAADDVPRLLRLAADLGHPLLGLEGFDVTLTDQMRARPLNTEHLPLLPPGQGWLLAELGSVGPAADTPAAVDEFAEAFSGALEASSAVQHLTGYRRYDDAPTQARVWAIRESGLGATAVLPDGRHNHEGWEDAAVAPERLGEYLREIIALWREFGYSGAWYGHFGQGCVHTRNDFDLHSASGLTAYRSYVERATDLVKRLGGSISGEHGDGQARGELLERLYGAELVDAFRQVKTIFDPRGRMNPGKVVDAYPLDENLRYGPDYRGWQANPAPQGRRLHFSLSDDAGSLQRAAERCVGVGRCRRDDTGVMCPSYRATRDERHSTRGRAKLLVELFQGEATPATWRNEDVRQALDLCLACKGCAVDCPTHVDMATYKAEFMAQYYQGRLRPRELYALGLIPIAARAARRVPKLANAVLSAPGLGTAVRRAAGVTTRRPAPAFAPRRVPRGDLADATVVVWPDTFTDAYRSDFAADLLAVLELLGERVAVPEAWGCCGRPMFDAGFLDTAKRVGRRALDAMAPYLEAGVPVIVPEPSCLASFRDELPALFGADANGGPVEQRYAEAAARLKQVARSPAEHLLTLPRVNSLRDHGPHDERVRVALHPHCHARADGATPADLEVLRRLGFEASIVDGGCCGLAGSFGFSAKHEALSRQIGVEQWLPALRAAAAGADHLVIDGFSCTLQRDHLAADLDATTVVRLALAALTVAQAP